jgi:hypothetical protein
MSDYISSKTLEEFSKAVQDRKLVNFKQIDPFTAFTCLQLVCASVVRGDNSYRVPVHLAKRFLQIDAPTGFNHARNTVAIFFGAISE